MSEELSYTQKQNLISHLFDGLSYDPERIYPSDSVSEIVDSWLPIYYNDIRAEWVDAGCPEPDELMPDNNEHSQMSIHNLMQLGLYEVALQFASGAIWSRCGGAGEANTHGEALENLRDNYPEHMSGTMLDHYPNLKDLVE